jgi:signal transduction histidine kinase
VQDFTERRRITEELRRAHDELEQRVRERTAELEDANRQLLEHQRATRQLASQVSLAEEQERRRIAAGLHDDVGQMLALIKMKLGTIDPHGISAVSDDLRSVRKLLDEAIRRTRSLTFDLGARVLYEFGLATAIENLVDQFREQHRITATFEDDERPKPLDEGIEVALYRATRELLHNVAKHARAQHIVVRLSCDTDTCRCVRIEASDDGVGFDPARHGAQPPKGGGFGLFNIRERLEYVGGKMTIDSTPGEGTRVTLQAPMKQESPVSDEVSWQI